MWLFSDEAPIMQQQSDCLPSVWLFFSIAGRLHHYRWVWAFAHKALENSNLMTFLRSRRRVTLIRSLKSTRANWNMLETGKKSYLIKNLSSFKRFFSCSHQLTWRCRRTLPEKLQRWSGGKKVMKEEKLIYLRIAEILSSKFHSALYFA